MTVLREIIEQLSENIIVANKTGRNILFPRDFEVYMCGLELTTFEGDTIDYFIFPVTPNSINKTEADRVSFFRTFGGVTVLNSDSFTPGQLTVSGDFGRTFKLLLRNTDNTLATFRGVRFSNQAGVYGADDVNGQFNSKIPELFPTIKTGYGCIKILQSIINKARGNDNGRPFRLYFYNSMLSESYLVIPTKNPLQLNQEISSNNMIWRYTLNLNIIAPLENILFDDKEQTAKDFLIPATIQKSVNNMAKKAVKFGSSLVRRV